MLIEKLRRLFFCLLVTLYFNQIVFSQEVPDSGNKADKSILENADIKDKTDTSSEKPADNKDKADSGTKSKGEVKLGKIVVTPTKTGHKLSDSPAAVTVIDSDDIKLSGGKHIDETIDSATGIYFKRSKISDTTTKLSIRGFAGNGNNLIMWNGMPINDSYNSSPEWNLHSMNATDSLEIVKGPYSSLYGRNAMGGVVNIITKTPDKQEFSLKTGIGSNNTYTGYASYGDKYYDCLSVFLSYDYMSSAGTRNQLITISPSAGTGSTSVTGWEATTDATGAKSYIIGDAGENCWNQWVATGKFVWDINQDSKLAYSFKVSEYNYGYNDPRSYLKGADGYAVTGGSGTNNTSITITDGIDYKYTLRDYTFLKGSGNTKNQLNVVDYILNAGMFNLSVKLGSNSAPGKYTTTKSSASFEGGTGYLNKTDPALTLFGDVQVDVKYPEDLVLTVGYSMRHDHAESNQWNLYNWKDYDSIIGDDTTNHFSEMEGSQLMNSVYSQAQYDLIKKILICYAGLRLDYWKNYDGESRYNTTEKDYDTTTDWHVSPKASIVFKPGVEFLLVKLETLRASAGSAYNPPNIYQLYKYWTSGSTEYNPNPELKPETSWSWETGGDLTFFNKILIVSGTYFGSNVENLIYYRVIDSTHKQYENAGKGKIHGYELEGKAYIMDYFELYGNMTKTYTEVTENDTDPDSVGKQFVGVPELMYNAGIKVLYKYTEGSLNWRYCDHVYNNSDNSDTIEGVYKSYDTIKLLDLKVSVMPRENVKFSLSVNNILDREYYQYYLCEGRNYYWEAEIKI